MAQPDVVVVGQVARDLVLLVDAVLDPERSTEVRERQEVRGGKGRSASTAADRRPQGTMTARPVTLPSCSSP